MGAIREGQKRVVRITVKGPKSRAQVLKLRAELKKVAAKHKVKLEPRARRKKRK